MSQPPIMLIPNPNLSLFISIRISFPGIIGHVAGSGSGSSGILVFDVHLRVDNAGDVFGVIVAVGTSVVGAVKTKFDI